MFSDYLNGKCKFYSFSFSSCFLYLVLSGSFHPQYTLAESHTFCLSGNDWSLSPVITDIQKDLCFYKKFISDNWNIPATVPGNIQADIESALLLTPLWYGAGDPLMAQVTQSDWIYKKTFSVPEYFHGKRITLVFDGVDEKCQIVLNSKEIGSHNGMFERFEFDVTESINIGQINELIVRISGISQELADTVAKADAKEGVNVVTSSNWIRKKSKELKSAVNCAYDWGISIYTLGIWKDVRLETSGPARINWIQAKSTLENNYKRALLISTLEIDSTKSINTDIEYLINDGHTAVKSLRNLHIEKGINTITTDFVLENPELWWPNGHGKQPLYELEVLIKEHISGDFIHYKKTRFGIREICWELTEGTAGNFQNRFKLVLNGRPIRMMGSNIVPPDLLFGRIRNNGLRLMHLAKEAGFNKLRVWGGGIILSDEIYDLADELGIMLFQEFPLANCAVEADSEFLVNLEDTAINIVKQLRNHPSIIEWSGGNEMPWPSSDYPALEVLRNVTKTYDNRIFRDTCPIQGEGDHWPYIFHPDACPPGGWGYQGMNFYQGWNARTGMRFGEFATNSPANLEIWHREIPPSSQWPLNNIEDPILVRKNIFHAVSGTSWLHNEIIEDTFGPLENLDSLIEAGQFFAAEGLRYAIDTLRRNGKSLGGFTTWNYNEPWPNGAGSYMVDYDGRPLMNYDFVKQALAPVVLSICQEGIFFDPKDGINVSLWITSDTTTPMHSLKWQWTARDRNGKILNKNNGMASVLPQEVKFIEDIRIMPLDETALGPWFLELELLDKKCNRLAERIHIFGAQGFRGQLKGLLDNTQFIVGKSVDDIKVINSKKESLPDNPANLAYVGNGAKPATATSARPEAIHQPAGINDGHYGNSHSWIGNEPQSSFMIDLNQDTVIGCFTLGRDRKGELIDRLIDYIKIETSLDKEQWQTVFERQNITAMFDSKRDGTMKIEIPPVKTQYVKVTTKPQGTCIDEFEIYPPAENAKEGLPDITVTEAEQDPWIYRPVRRTSLTASVLPIKIEANQEILQMNIKNNGTMTALFCEVHPLIEYRTDLFIDNNHSFIPPGEIRSITIKASLVSEGGLRLAQTGWRISCWNAEDVIIAPDDSVLFSLGRRDKMCREYFGYNGSSVSRDSFSYHAKGNRPPTSCFPFLQICSEEPVKFSFEVSAKQASHAARLRIHSSDQSNEFCPKLKISVNNHPFLITLPVGLGIQKDIPSHLARPCSIEYNLPGGFIKEGTNTITIEVTNKSWFTWDSLDIINI